MELPRASLASSGSSGTSRSGRTVESLAELKEKLINFYKVYDPAKLQDEVKVNELLIWARKYSERALVGLMQRKYGVAIDAVDSSESGWAAIRADLYKFYKKHDRNKSPEQVQSIYDWTRQNGLAKLNDRLVSKYGVPLQSIKQQGGGLSAFKERYRHLVIAQNLGNLSDQVRAFYAQHDPSKPQAEIDRVVQYGMQNGRDAVNESLKQKYGQNLDDVHLVEGATSDERTYNLRKRLLEFYAVHDPGNSTEDKVQAMCDWGVHNYSELNKLLLRTYGYDLDTKKVVPEELRGELFAYFSNLSSSRAAAKTGKGELEELVEFAVQKGREALNQRLILKFGKPLPDPADELDLQARRHMADQAPKMSRLSVKSIRRSLSSAMRRSLSGNPSE